MGIFGIIMFYLIAAFFIILLKKNMIETFGIPTDHERPFVNVYSDKGEQLKIVLLSHPFTRDSSWEQYKEYRRDGFLILGISSYNEFPLITTNKLDTLNNPEEKAWKNYDYMSLVEGWLHCFRDPKKYIKSEMPRILISESDFCNSEVYCPNRHIEKKYDFIYLCPKDSDKNCDGWVSVNKNWELAKKCLEILCGSFKLTGLLVGRKGCQIPKVCDGLVETTDFLSQNELIKSYRQSRFIFIPNQSDASPRILTEALCCNIPAIVNYNILGGWKYINKKTGAFFKNETDISKAIEHVINFNTTPRDNFLNNWGEENTGRQFKKFIEENFSDKIDVSKHKYLKL